MSKTGVLKALKVLSIAHDIVLQKERIEVYVMALEDLSDVRIEAAARTLIRTSKWFPKPSELREEAILGEMKEHLPSSSSAWAEVVEAIRSIGRDTVPNWSHGLIKQAVTGCGGWRKLCDSTQPEQDRRRFLELYTTGLEDTKRQMML